MKCLTLHYILLVLNILVTCQTDECIFGKVENKQLHCCTNYFLDNGECKECPSGYFGTNCSSGCIYPTYGQHCRNTCDCNVKDCNHVNGCQGNHSQTEISTSWSTKHTSSRNGYEHTSKINEGSANLTQFLSVFTSSKMSLTVDKTNNENNDYYNKKTGNGNSTIVILLVGCVLAILLAVNGITWISKFIRRNCGNLVNTRDNYILETVYMEINAGSEQQDSQANLIGATVITTSCTSLGGVETRPELPARNTINEDQNPCHAHNNEDDETYLNV